MNKQGKDICEKEQDIFIANSMNEKINPVERAYYAQMAKRNERYIEKHKAGKAQKNSMKKKRGNYDE
jgi:uncharacterized protein YcgL (UPF0745 family)